MFSVWNHHNVESDRSYHYHRYRLVASDGSGMAQVLLYFSIYFVIFKIWHSVRKANIFKLIFHPERKYMQRNEPKINVLKLLFFS